MARAAACWGQSTEPLRAYPLRHARAVELEAVLRPLLAGSGPTQLSIDADQNQLLLAGSETAQRIAQQLVDALDQPHSRAASPVRPGVLRAYAHAAGNLAELAGRLQAQLPADAHAQVSADEQTGQLLVWASADVQERIPELISLASASPDARADGGAWRRVSVVPLTKSKCQQLEPLLAQMLAGRLQPKPVVDAAAPRGYTLGGFPAGHVDLVFDRQREQVVIEGPAGVLGQVERLIRALDTPRTAGRVTRIVPLGGADFSKVRQAVDAYRQTDPRSEQSPTERDPQAFGSSLRVKPASQQQRPNIWLAKRLAAQPGAAALPANAQANTADDDQGAAIKDRLQELGSEVEVESLPDLDVIILRGNQQDVDEVIRIIKEIERLSAEAEPLVEVYQLEHVGSEKVANTVNAAKGPVLATRPGSVNVTALTKPNALLVIGWGEAMKVALDLIRKLDQPVDAATQLKVFALKHAPAAATQKTVEDFFAKRTNLGTKVIVTADPRTNALLVQADPRDLEEVELLISRIDSGQSAVQNELRVFRLKNTLASDLGPVLQNAVGGGSGGASSAAASATATNVRSLVLKFLTIDARGQRIVESGLLNDVKITPDPKTNTLLVSAPAESMELLAALIHELDSSPATTAQIKVFTIVNGDAPSLVEMLRALLDAPGQGGVGPQLAGAQADDSLAPLRFSVDVRTNTIIASGSAADLGIVEAILLRLDSSSTQERKNRVYRLKNAPAQNVAQSINDFLRSERLVQQSLPGSISGYRRIETEVVVVPELISNSLVISATPRYYDEIIKIVEELDAQPPQVMIQVLLAEVQLNKTDEFGVELGLQDTVLFDRSVLEQVLPSTATPGYQELNPGYNFNNRPLRSADGSRSDIVGGQGLTNFNLGRVSDAAGFGGLVLGASSRNVSILLRALSEKRRVDVLSRPQIMTLDNQPAFIQIGQRVPRISVSTVNNVASNFGVILENVGLILGVTPRISPEGMIVMEVDAENSSLNTSISQTIAVASNGTPIVQNGFNVTQAQTTVSAASGQTIVLGGLISDQVTTRQRRVPWLSDVPVVGNLFRYDQKVGSRRELLIILTPHIIRSEEDANRVKQMEAARMSWCLSDVYRVHGDLGLHEATGEWMSQDAPVVIYPDQDPRGVGMPSPQHLPPGAGQPVIIEEVPSGPWLEHPSQPIPGPAAQPSPSPSELNWRRRQGQRAATPATAVRPASPAAAPPTVAAPTKPPVVVAARPTRPATGAAPQEWTDEWDDVRALHAPRRRKAPDYVTGP